MWVWGGEEKVFRLSGELGPMRGWLLCLRRFPLLGKIWENKEHMKRTMFSFGQVGTTSALVRVRTLVFRSAPGSLHYFRCRASRLCPVPKVDVDYV